MNKQKMLSPTRIRRMKAQGYTYQSDEKLSALAFGNRFAYRLCTGLLTIGVVTSSIPVLSVMLVIAFLGIILPNHPFDYIYNGFLAKRMNKPMLPSRSKQLKFACMIATMTITITIYLFFADFTTAGYIMGAILAGTAFLVGTTDYCIPSEVYNRLYEKKEAKGFITQAQGPHKPKSTTAR